METLRKKGGCSRTALDGGISHPFLHRNHVARTNALGHTNALCPTVTSQMVCKQIPLTLQSGWPEAVDVHPRIGQVRGRGISATLPTHRWGDHRAHGRRRIDGRRSHRRRVVAGQPPLSSAQCVHFSVFSALLHHQERLMLLSCCKRLKVQFMPCVHRCWFQLSDNCGAPKTVEAAVFFVCIIYCHKLGLYIVRFAINADQMKTTCRA